MLQVGLNPYGLTYLLGLQGQGTPRANPNGRGLTGFVELAEEFGARCIELHALWMAGYSASDFARVRERLAASRMIPVISLGPPLEGVDLAIAAAIGVGANVIRLGLTPVLAGDRAAEGLRWAEMVQHVRNTLRRYAPVAAAAGLSFAIEDHQDFGSDELLEFCEEAGPNVGICLDTGNAFAVAEEPVVFARKVAHAVRHVHLKDYNPQWTDEGYRLVRCAIGDGAVPFPEIAAVLAGHHESLTASLEPGALDVRHIRLFTQAWWAGYPEKTSRELASCLEAARRRRLDECADWRTPWEACAPPAELIDYELKMMQKSVENMRKLRWM